MRRLFLSKNIQGIADEYSARLQNECRVGTTIIKPLKRLTNLENEIRTGIYKTNDWKPLRKAEREQYADYVKHIVALYPNQLLNATPKKLLELEEQFRATFALDLNLTLKKRKNGDAKSFHAIIVETMQYKEIRSHLIIEYIKRLGIKTCCYCNANYAITTDDNQAYYELDHWRPKSICPALCISFFNLQPTCTTCNRTKNNDDVHEYLNIWEEDKYADREVFRFSIDPKKIVSYWVGHSENELQIRFEANSDDTQKIRDDMDSQLHIESIYQQHRDVVAEALWRKKIYTPSNMEVLKSSLGDTFVSEKEYERFVTGTYSNADEIFKRPLTKLIQDVMREGDEHESRKG